VVAFDEMTAKDFRTTIEINLFGTVNVCRAAWPHMKAAGYGRIVNVSSGSMAGYAWQSAYAAAKGGVFSFTRALAVEGAAHGIKANTLLPGALTRMVHAAQGEDSPFIAHARDALPPELVSPTVAFLAHESVPVSGEAFESLGGQVNRFYLARTPGFAEPAPTPELIAERWEDLLAGTAEGIALNTDADPREWSIKPYRPWA
jgi:NAD(P)-dependent dehydrogenase (short-subunit alcohol dehydrogenase family)